MNTSNPPTSGPGQAPLLARKLFSIGQAISNTALGLTTVLFLIMLFVVTLQILPRVLDLLPESLGIDFPFLIWTEEISRFLLIWIIMLGSAVGLWRCTHFTVTIFSEPKTAVGRKWARAAITACVLCFAFFWLWEGWYYAREQSWDVSDVTGINMIVVGITVPIAGALWVIFTLMHLAITLFGGESLLRHKPEESAEGEE